MARGGKREGAGRKGTWKSGATKTVKLPVALIDATLAYARKLDDGAAPAGLIPESKRVTPVAEAPSADKGTAELFRLVDEKRELAKQVEHLKAELARSKRKLEMEEARAKGLEFRVRDASSVLSNALAEVRGGVRKGIQVKDVRSALLALGIDAERAD